MIMAKSSRAWAACRRVSCRSGSSARSLMSLVCRLTLPLTIASPCFTPDYRGATRRSARTVISALRRAHLPAIGPCSGRRIIYPSDKQGFFWFQRIRDVGQKLVFGSNDACRIFSQSGCLSSMTYLALSTIVSPNQPLCGATPFSKTYLITPNAFLLADRQ